MNCWKRFERYDEQKEETTENYFSLRSTRAHSFSKRTNGRGKDFYASTSPINLAVISRLDRAPAPHGFHRIRCSDIFTTRMENTVHVEQGMRLFLNLLGPVSSLSPPNFREFDLSNIPFSSLFAVSTLLKELPFL